MASEQDSVPKTGAAIPSWVEASIFEAVFKEICPQYQQTKKFKVKPALAAGENYATVMLRIEAEIELKDKSTTGITLMLKTSHDNEVFLEITKKHDVFDIEATMYREVVPEFEELYRQVGVEVRFGPKAYELPIDKPYILLEDLRPLGFENVNRLEGLDIKHTKAVLTRLAQWHAASAVRVSTKGLYKPIICESLFNEENKEMMRTIFCGLGDVFLKCVKSYEGHEEYYERLVEKKEDRLDEILEANKTNENEFNVLNHGDCWSNNVMFKHDDQGNILDTYLIDYQVTHYGSPAQDLYYFLLSSTQYEIKTKKFDYFIKYYHDRLLEHLKLLNYPKKAPTLKDIHIALHKYNAWAYNATTGVMSAVLLEPNENANLENFVGDTDVAAAFKMQLFLNPRYRKHMEMILPWMYYRGAV